MSYKRNNWKTGLSGFLLLFSILPNLVATTFEGADVVIQDYVMAVELQRYSQVSITYNVTYQVLNPTGLKRVQFAKVTDSFQNLTQFSAYYNDRDGKVMAYFDMGDLNEESLISGSSLYDDNRIKYLPKFSVTEFPITVKYSYEVNLKSSFYLPEFMPIQAYGIALEKGTFILKDNEQHPTLIQLKNWSGSERQILEPNVYTWSIHDVSPLKIESHTLELAQLLPSIELAASFFEMGNTRGGFKSWQAFGRWISDLFDQGDELPMEAVSEVTNLVKGVSTTPEKAKILYDFLQENTRYVSIQLGIGGFQPSSAKEVSEVGYGDCKALSNYMVRMLKAVGVEAHSALVYSGDDHFRSVSNFPANNFNHVIVCLPNGGDSLWLECTSSTLPFNFLPPSTLDRYALLMDGSSSTLVRTPVGPRSLSKQETFLDATISENGPLDLKLKQTGNGVFLPLLSYLESISQKDQQKWWARHFPSWDLKDPQIIVDENSFSGQISTALHQEKGVKKAGKWLFVNRQIDQQSNVPDSIKSPEERTQQIYIEFDRSFLESWTLHLPEGYHLRKLSPSIQVENQFGSFTLSHGQDETIFSIELVLRKGLYPPQAASEFNQLVSPFISFRNSKWVIQTEG